MRLLRREDAVVGLADDVGRLEADNLAAGGVVENVAAAIFHVLDENADRQAAHNAVEKRTRIARLPVGTVDLGAVGDDRQDRVDAIEAHVAAISQHLHYFAIGLEVLPALGAAEVGARFDGCPHAFALALRTDVQHGHSAVVLAAVAVELHCRVVDGQEAERLGVVDPHRCRMSDEKCLEIFVFSRFEALDAASGEFRSFRCSSMLPDVPNGLSPDWPRRYQSHKVLKI